MDIAELIRQAKIGRERKEAQVETCAPFAAALHDVLVECGLAPSLVCVANRQGSVSSWWYHSVVSVDGVMYDSLGEFSEEIIRKRLKVRPTTDYKLEFETEKREGCYDEEDYALLYEFLLNKLRASARKLMPSATAPPSRKFG